MAPRKNLREQHDDPALPFDVTQDIEPSLSEDLHGTPEPTLTQVDFGEVTDVLPRIPTRG